MLRSLVVTVAALAFVSPALAVEVLSSAAVGRAASPGSIGGIEVANLPERIDNRPIVAPSVPEPASWAMMIAGFGLVGAMVRRRRPRIA